MSLRKKVIRLAYQKPSLRYVLLPLLAYKQATLRGWKKGLIPISMHDYGKEFMSYEEGVVYGVWGISKQSAGTVTHIPSGLAVYHAKTVAIAKAFVEAMFSIDPRLATERNTNTLASTYKSQILGLVRSRPDDWPTLDPGTKVPNVYFEYEGDLPVKVLQETQISLPKNWLRILKDIAMQGHIPSRSHPKKTIVDMLVKDLVKHTSKGLTWTAKGEKSYQDGYITGKFYVDA